MKVQFDIVTENDESGIKAIISLLSMSGLTTKNFNSIIEVGEINGWPIMEVGFKDEEAARIFTAFYLDVSKDDQEVTEYLQTV